MNGDNQQEISQQENSQHQQQAEANLVVEGANASVAGPSSLSSDDEVPAGTLREERLVKKLKVIDVLSPKSSIDIADNEVDSIIQPAFNQMNINERNNQMAAMQNESQNNHKPMMSQFKHQYASSQQKTISFGGTIPRCREPKPLPSRLTLLVNGTRFVVNPCIFTKHPNTLLGRYVSNCIFVFLLIFKNNGSRMSLCLFHKNRLLFAFILFKKETDKE